MSPGTRIPPASLLLSLRGSVLTADPAWTVFTGLDVERLQDSDVWDVVEEPDHRALRAAIDELVAGGTPVLLALGVQHTGGRGVPVLVELALLDDAAGAPVLTLAARTGAGVTPGMVHEAWRHGRLTLYAQPIRDAGSLAVIRHELLVRMLLPDDRLVPASSFLPAAERMGLAVDIDCWVAGRAGAMLAGPGREAMVLELNVTAATVRRPELFLRTLEMVLGAEQIAGGRLMVALPSEAVMAHPEAALHLLAGLKGLGIGTALDHVGGTGDELELIDLLPFDTIKISGRLAADALADGHGLARLVRVVEAAHRRDAEAVASSIDDSEALTLVRVHGVDALQGFQLGAPVEATGS